MRADLLDEYESESEVEYQGEGYLVRDNGAVCRKSRAGQRRRKLDDVWTFGAPNHSTGYMHLGSHIVHRIVALAFHEQPSEQHVVDHIDTNRRNNRADNLRWVTRLDNLLLNQITRARIARAYGSLDAFFKDPSAISNRDPDFSWMRTVSKSEAEESRRRLLGWAESDLAPRGGQLGEWVYGPRTPNAQSAEEIQDIQSLTPMAIQRNWKTIGEFPACPESIGAEPLTEYAARLKPETVFYTNMFGNAVTATAGESAALLGVVCRMPHPSVKDWALSKITVENGKFVHESMGTFFSLDGALNAYRALLGIDAPHVETIDDYS
jgi:hypothetical protein